MKESLEKRLNKQDESALLEIIDEYSRLIATVIYNTSKGSLSKEDIEETVSDVFITLWNNAKKVQEGKLKGYLCTIARTRTLNKIAANKNRNILNIDNYDPEDDFSIEDETEKNDIHKVLREIIDKLKIPDKDILIRYYFYSQTVTQISDGMKINIETVKSKLRRTREKIKKELIERSFTI